LRRVHCVRILAAGTLLLLDSCRFVLEGPTSLVAKPYGDSKPVMILDSPAAREALAREARRERLSGDHITEKKIAIWRAFMRSLSGPQVVELAQGTRMVERGCGDYHCSGWPDYMIKVRVSDGPYHDKEGWLCEVYLAHVLDWGATWSGGHSP
jgi:hypothetical protein